MLLHPRLIKDARRSVYSQQSVRKPSLRTWGAGSGMWGSVLALAVPAWGPELGSPTPTREASDLSCWGAETGRSQGLAGSHSSERPCLDIAESVTLWFPPAHTHRCVHTHAHVHGGACVPQSNSSTRTLCLVITVLQGCIVRLCLHKGYWVLSIMSSRVLLLLRKFSL